MSDNSFDALSKLAATSATRRQTLRGLAGVLGGALLATLGGSRALAALPPQSCVTCICGVGRPCNPKFTCCTVIPSTFPADITAACTGVCTNQGGRFCGPQGAPFHCPRGCLENVC